MKRCPQCAEKIQDAALVCRFCGKAQPPPEGGKGTLILVCIGAVIIVGMFNQITGKRGEPQTATSENAKTDSVAPNATKVVSPQSECMKWEGISKNAPVSVSGSVDLRAGPSPDSARLVNEKATDVMGETHYQSVDNTTRLRETCRKDNWAHVEMIEPDWLAGQNGWIPASELRSIESDATEKRVYVEADFYWDNDTEQHKKQLVAAVNRLVRESRRCPTVDPGTLSKSGNRGTPNDPIYFITCVSGSDVFNVWFNLSREQP